MKDHFTQPKCPSQMGEQNVVYMYNGTLFSLIKEGNLNTCYNMNEP